MSNFKTAKQIPIGGRIIDSGNSIEFKTGNWKAKKPVHNKKVCINCMRCAVYCPDMAIKVRNARIKQTQKMEIDYVDMNFCKGCGICEVECPVKAIKMENVC